MSYESSYNYVCYDHMKWKEAGASCLVCIEQYKYLGLGGRWRAVITDYDSADYDLDFYVVDCSDEAAARAWANRFMQDANGPRFMGLEGLQGADGIRHYRDDGRGWGIGITGREPTEEEIAQGEAFSAEPF